MPFCILKGREIAKIQLLPLYTRSGNIIGVCSSALVNNLVASICVKMTSLQNLCLYSENKVTVDLGERLSNAAYLHCCIGDWLYFSSYKSNTLLRLSRWGGYFLHVTYSSYLFLKEEDGLSASCWQTLICFCRWLPDRLSLLAF